MRRRILLLSGLGLAAGLVVAQINPNWPSWAGGRGQSRFDRAETARDVTSDSTGTPMW